MSLNFGGNGQGGDIVVLAGRAELAPDAGPADADPAYVAKYADGFALARDDGRRVRRRLPGADPDPAHRAARALSCRHRTSGTDQGGDADHYARPMGDWTFLTNHAHVLLSISRDPDVRIRDLAERLGVTERAAQRILTDLVEQGYLERIR